MITQKKGCKNWYVVFKKNNKLIWYATHSPDEDKAKQMELELKAGILNTKVAEEAKKFIERMTGIIVPERGMLIQSAWIYYKDEYCKGQAESSVKGKEREWDDFIKWLERRYPEKKFLHEVDFRIAKEYEKILERQEISGHTFNLKVGLLKNIFERLRQQAEMRDNPFETIKSKPKDSIPYKAFTDAEVTAILGKCNPLWKTACMIGLHTGFDFANVRHMKWSELVKVDTEKGKRLVIQTVRLKTKRKFEGRKSLFVPVSKELEKHLLSLSKTGAYILPDRFRTRNVEGEFAAILKEAEIKADGLKLGFHCWRHTANSKLQASGVAVDTRQQLMGHSSMDTNLIYSNSMKPLFDAIDGLEKDK